MTRINCVPVEILTDQHLQAEYREITRVARTATYLQDYGHYKMGSGHVKFFYNKGTYLSRRTVELFDELRARGFLWKLKIYKMHDKGLDLDWEPSEVAVEVNLNRLRQRVFDGPGKHTFWGQSVNYSHYGAMDYTDTIYISQEIK